MAFLQSAALEFRAWAVERFVAVVFATLKPECDTKTVPWLATRLGSSLFRDPHTYVSIWAAGTMWFAGFELTARAKARSLKL